MRFQNRGIDEIGRIDDCGIESGSVAVWDRERNCIRLELGLHAPTAANMVHEHDSRKLTVNLVVEIAWDKPAGIEDGDRRLPYFPRTGQLSDERKDQMGRRVETVDRAMIRWVVQVRLDCDLLAGLVSGVATIMSAVEIVEDGTPCLGIAL